MILEAATLRVKPGQINDFESVFRSAYGLISGMNGYLGHELFKCVENRDEYILLIRWGAIREAVAGIRKSPQYMKWLDMLAPFCVDLPETRHYIDIRVGGREQEEARYRPEDTADTPEG